MSHHTWELLLGLAAIGVIAAAIGFMQEWLSLRLVGLVVLLGTFVIGATAMVRYTPNQPDPITLPTSPLASPTPSPSLSPSHSPKPKPKPKRKKPRPAPPAPVQTTQPAPPAPQPHHPTPPPVIGGTPSPP